ncbi:unnamed protein product [Amoebophrya sp. A120]|nr:unnamed protein product [Amoebophrya sp. A120]|eukprot:GSA120T00018980001.1
MDGRSNMSSVSEPVSVDDLEAILRDWNIEDGDQVLSVSSSRGGAVAAAAAALHSDEEGGTGAIDVDSWTSELMGQLSNCQNDHTMATEAIKQFLRAFETQATNAATTRSKSLANANRILLKTLQRIHHNHKQVTNSLPQLQKQVEEQRTRAEVAESRCKVLELHLQRAMSMSDTHHQTRFDI